MNPLVLAIGLDATQRGGAGLCPSCGNRLDRILAVDDCPTNFQNHNQIGA